MKTKHSLIKAIVAAAALMTMGAGHAAGRPWDWHFHAGHGELDISQSGMDALEASGSYLWTSTNATYDDATGQFSLPFTGGVSAGDNIQTMRSADSSLHIQRGVTRYGKTTLDRLMTLSNFVFDLNAKTVSAKIHGTDLLTGVGTDYGFGTIFSAVGAEGGHLEIFSINNGLILANTSAATTGVLTISTFAADNFLSILGLAPVGGVSDLLRNADWGVFKASVVMSNALPEPAVYLSALAGLAILGATRLRKRQAAV